MISFAIGVAVGAAFHPFWSALWAKAKETDFYKKLVAYFK